MVNVILREVVAYSPLRLSFVCFTIKSLKLSCYPSLPYHINIGLPRIDKASVVSCRELFVQVTEL